jgi:hypothetical protein
MDSDPDSQRAAGLAQGAKRKRPGPVGGPAGQAGDPARGEALSPHGEWYADLVARRIARQLKRRVLPAEALTGTLASYRFEGAAAALGGAAELFLGRAKEAGAGFGAVGVGGGSNDYASLILPAGVTEEAFERAFRDDRLQLHHLRSTSMRQVAADGAAPLSSPNRRVRARPAEEAECPTGEAMPPGRPRTASAPESVREHRAPGGAAPGAAAEPPGGPQASLPVRPSFRASILHATRGPPLSTKERRARAADWRRLVDGASPPGDAPGLLRALALVRGQGGVTEAGAAAWPHELIDPLAPCSLGSSLFLAPCQEWNPDDMIGAVMFSCHPAPAGASGGPAGLAACASRTAVRARGRAAYIAIRVPHGSEFSTVGIATLLEEELWRRRRTLRDGHACFEGGDDCSAFESGGGRPIFEGGGGGRAFEGDGGMKDDIDEEHSAPQDPAESAGESDYSECSTGHDGDHESAGEGEDALMHTGGFGGGQTNRSDAAGRKPEGSGFGSLHRSSSSSEICK